MLIPQLLQRLKLFSDSETERNKYFTDEPLRSELFSSEQMEQHGKMLASVHELSKTRSIDKLLLRLADNERKLLDVRNMLTKSLKEGFQITPAGEWLLDNFYLIEEQIMLAKKHLPKVYSESLPQLANENAKGLPRVYDIALEIISHSDGRLDMEIADHFMKVYQSVTNLQIGELWALPIMLRLALIENLRRVSARIAIDRNYRNIADRWAKEMIDATEHEPKRLIMVIADMARSNPPLEMAFVAELTRQLKGRGPTLNQALTWLEERLSENGNTSSEMVQEENQKQAADQLSVSNSINSFRVLSSTNWPDFVEDNSAIERVLRKDKIYPLLDFSTRDHYRHVVEGIAHRSDATEEQVAGMALALTLKNDDQRRSHVGYYLIGDGLEETERSAKMYLPANVLMRRFFARHILAAYLSPILILTLGLTTAITLKVYSRSSDLALIIVFAFISIASASQLAVSLVNFLATLIVKPALLPKMDFSKGIPEKYKTFVAVPSLLINESEVEALVEALEIRYLANKQPHLYFGLLTDFRDAKTENMPGDEDLLRLAITKIEELNNKYCPDGNSIFYLLHRPRRWNPGEKKWMGYERKRGKLADLNNLLRENNREPFSHVIGDVSLLSGVKYIITLDSDTLLPRDVASKMIATMAHPLNAAIYDEQKKRVIKGYGILQPRVAVNMPRIDSSEYAKLNSNNDAGVDPYTRATSDVYQDLFGEGSFIGKGIYDIDAFELSLKGRFPENRILSHDLLEGCHARSGLISDIQLYEKYPSRYSTDMSRRERWIRGDWQIAAWFMPWVPDAKNKLHINPLSALSRWKIFDNIRRSIFPISVTLLILLSWMLLPEAAVWTLIVSGLIVIPAIASTMWSMVVKSKDVIFWHHLVLSSRSAGNTAVSTIFTLMCLPYEAFLNFVTILQTCWRMWISHRHLLEWSASAIIDLKGPYGLLTSYLIMAFEPLAAIGATVYIYETAPAKMIVAGPILFLWILAPAITWWASQPTAKKSAKLSPEQKIFLQKAARRIWLFFEDFVTEAENWLPPDNMQEVPVPTIAHRTSPTNIGLALLGNLSAYDFGFISQAQLLDRTEKTFSTLQKMERYKGHFYNWYNTQTLAPLAPRYISTVDSGNLAGHLLTLRQGILALTDDKIICDNFCDGLRTTLRLLSDNVDKNDFEKLQHFKTEVENIKGTEQLTLLDIKTYLENLNKASDSILNQLKGPDGSPAQYWKQALSGQISKAFEDFKAILPWIFSALPDGLSAIVKSQGLLSLKELKELHQQILSGGNLANQTGDDFETMMAAAEKEIDRRLSMIETVAESCRDYADVEWQFLYDEDKHLFTIGYNADEHRADSGYYDLLASEARLAIFLAIAEGKIPQESWFALGRHLVDVNGNPVLLSWSGSMFEYLMPLLVMPTYTNTLLNRTDISCVQRQITYGKQRGVPWGTSESGYNMLDGSQNYQYKAFGVPGLGLKRGLGEDLVVAPYASVLALMVSPEKSCLNLQQLAADGFEAKYGFYEAIDYTASRLQRGQTYAIIQSFMAHHQGMSLLSLTYLLLGQPMQKRFESDPQFNATLLLLEERIPKTTSFYVHTTDIGDVHGIASESEMRIIRTPYTPVPEVQLLSNGTYHAMVTNAGAGYSSWKGNAVTRWREDVTCDSRGVFCYIRDIETGEYWSTTYQPTLKKGKNYEVAFSQGRADFKDQQNDIETHTEIVVSPEDDIEMRRVHITNRSGRRKVIDLTSYAEAVIAPFDKDISHMTFSNLFVETEILKPHNAIICRRRPSTSAEKLPMMFHLAKLHGKKADEISYETDRAKFLGRTRTAMNPLALEKRGPLSDSEGAVLDPIVAIRYKLTLEENETVIYDMLIGAAETSEGCHALIDKYQDKHHKDRVFELAWTHSQVMLRQMNASEAEAQLYNRMAGSVVYLNPALRADPLVLIKNRKGQPGLWPYSISGDLPIVFISVEDQTNIELIKQLIQAHTYWRLKGLAVDLVIWNESPGGYRQVLQNQIMGLIGNVPDEKPGGVFVRSADQISAEDRILLQTVARICITGHEGNLQDYVNRKTVAKINVPYLVPMQQLTPFIATEQVKADLQFDNSFGGYTAGGDEYVIITNDKKVTPTPWVNVLANPNFGTMISESGQSYTWSQNAHEYRLTPWSNDPVSDTGGEIFYIRDEETGHFWSVTPLPRCSTSQYTVRHGFGYSSFEHIEDGIQSELLVYVDIEAAIKFSVIKLKNISGRQRRISITSYNEWVLGELRHKTSMYVTTEPEPETGALFAKNTYNTEFSQMVAFLDTDEPGKTFTGDRNEFIGRNKSLQNPDAMLRTRLSGKRGIGVDPCAALQVVVELSSGQQREVVFKLGSGKNHAEAVSMVKKFRGRDKAAESLEKVKSFWSKTLKTIEVQTPDKAFDLMANGWLLYQTLVCRMWARTGFYQSSGAFGFRDQLQDSMAMVHALPRLTHDQILLCASKQFKEGDVMHWWHPPVGRGVRTHCSDDYLWLPFVTLHYINSIGDTEILNEVVPFIEGRILGAEEASSYDLPATSQQFGTIYEHCVRAIRNGLKFGEHGLPLMGTGDWNDGMDQVGEHGKGESIWLAFFLYSILKDFSDLAIRYNDKAFADLCESEAQRLHDNIDKHGWDGNWYLRAYFDDGTPLGSAHNDECQIDSIAQSWSVISGAGSQERTGMALESAYDKLVEKPPIDIIRLLRPPFDKTNMEPGYIKGYIPGVRENGGQYTHGAVWLIMAFAKMGNANRAWELLSKINPINHALTQSAAATYKGEPYVLAGDVLAPPNTVQAGWTWYTGSAGWMYRLMTDVVLGIRLKGGKLHIEPCVPDEWNSFKVVYRYGSSVYNISFTKHLESGELNFAIDGQTHEAGPISLTDDGGQHEILVNIYQGSSKTVSTK